MPRWTIASVRVSMELVASSRIMFNNSYLMDAFKAAPADTLRINIVNGSAPCIITPEDGGDSFLYMILPVRLRAEG